MSYRKIAMWGMYVVFLLMFWVVINWNCFPMFLPGDIDGLQQMTFSDRGYNATGTHAITMMIWYVLLLYLAIPKVESQQLIRLSRNRYLFRQVYGKALGMTFLFTLIMESVLLIPVVLVNGWELLSRISFFEVALLQGLYDLLFYALFGCLYAWLFTLFGVAAKAIALTVSASILMRFLADMLPVWMPIRIRDVFIRWNEPGLSAGGEIQQVLRIVILILALIGCNLVWFKRMDVLNDKK